MSEKPKNKLDYNKLKELTIEEKQKKELLKNKTVILIGTGSCGIAAGAKKVIKKFKEEIALHSLNNIIIKQTGCMGLCYSEPTVEVISPEMPATIYGNIGTEEASKIIRKHIMGKVLINDHIFDRPAPDFKIMEAKSGV